MRIEFSYQVEGENGIAAVGVAYDIGNRYAGRELYETATLRACCTKRSDLYRGRGRSLGALLILGILDEMLDGGAARIIFFTLLRRCECLSRLGETLIFRLIVRRES